MASRISRLTAVSSRKSTLSANRDTEPMRLATANSMKKYAKLAAATNATARRSGLDDASLTAWLNG